MTKKIIISTIALVALAAVLAVGCGSKPEYDPSKYVALEYKYFNGEGMALPVVTPPVGDNAQAAKEIVLLEKTQFIYAPDRGLSNGDTVTVTPVYDEETAKKQGFKPVVKEVKFTVEGLPEGTPVDLWESVNKVLFSGKNSLGRVDVFRKFPDNNKQLADFLADYTTYQRDVYQNLSNGDIVTITITYNKEQALERGYKIISEPTKEYTVTGLK